MACRKSGCDSPAVHGLAPAENLHSLAGSQRAPSWMVETNVGPERSSNRQMGWSSNRKTPRSQRGDPGAIPGRSTDSRDAYKRRSHLGRGQGTSVDAEVLMLLRSNPGSRGYRFGSLVQREDASLARWRRRFESGAIHYRGASAGADIGARESEDNASGLFMAWSSDLLNARPRVRERNVGTPCCAVEA